MICFSKFTSRLTDINLNLNCKNYGICEDIFQSLMHMISQKLLRNNILNKWV